MVTGKLQGSQLTVPRKDMKAYVVRNNGGLALFITGEYKTVKNLIRYGVKPYIKGTVEVELYRNWSRRFGNPDEIIKVTVP